MSPKQNSRRQALVSLTLTRRATARRYCTCSAVLANATSPRVGLRTCRAAVTKPCPARNTATAPVSTSVRGANSGCPRSNFAGGGYENGHYRHPRRPHRPAAALAALWNGLRFQRHTGRALRDKTAAFASRIWAGGRDAELYVWPGACTDEGQSDAAFSILGVMFFGPQAHAK
jgi:hypothetical protein